MSDDGVNDRDIEDATAHDDPELEELFRLVAQAFAEGDPPSPTDDSGISYVRWAAPDADLGVMFEVGLAGVRDDGDVGDDLEFIGARYRIAVGISPDRIVGEVSPWTAGSTLRLECDGGPTDIEVDDDGAFYVDSPAAGPVRLRVQSAAGEMVTEWFTVNPSRSS
jgi:hypothetical protein